MLLHLHGVGRVGGGLGLGSHWGLVGLAWKVLGLWEIVVGVLGCYWKSLGKSVLFLDNYVLLGLIIIIKIRNLAGFSNSYHGLSGVGFRRLCLEG